MTDDQFLQVDERPAVRLERTFPHPIDRVWLAVTDPEHLGQWFPTPVQLDLRVGGAMRFAVDGPELGETPDDAMSGEVLELDPPHRLAFRWGSDGLRFELTPDGDDTRFVLTHTFDDRAGAASFATGWGLCLAALAPVLAGEPLPPPDRGVARHEELATRFGLDHGTVTEDGDTWTVRFERQLTCPADIAWDLFFGKDADTGEQRTAPAVGEPLRPFAAPHLVLGTVTERDEHHVLAVDVAPDEPGEHLRLELVPGTGHGARLLLTVTGRTDRPDERDAAYDQWGAGAVEHIAAEGARWAQDEAEAEAGVRS